MSGHEDKYEMKSLYLSEETRIDSEGKLIALGIMSENIGVKKLPLVHINGLSVFCEVKLSSDAQGHNFEFSIQTDKETIIAQANITLIPSSGFGFLVFKIPGPIVFQEEGDYYCCLRPVDGDTDKRAWRKIRKITIRKFPDLANVFNSPEFKEKLQGLITEYTNKTQLHTRENSVS